MKVGIQLFSVKENMMKDPIQALKKVIETGYRSIEVANHFADKDFGIGFGVGPKEVNAILKEYDAEIFSAHVAPMTTNNIDAILEYHNEIGTKFLCIPMGFYNDRDGVMQNVDNFIKIGEKCKEAKIDLLYHNHFHEFQKFGDETVYDILTNNIAPDLMKLEIDTYWIMRAGECPVEFLKKYGKRIRLLHQKDYPKGFDDQINLIKDVHENNPLIDLDYFKKVANQELFTEIGQGIINIQEIIDTANEYCDADYIVLEQDNSSLDEMESIKISLENFKKFNGIEW